MDKKYNIKRAEDFTFEDFKEYMYNRGHDGNWSLSIARHCIDFRSKFPNYKFLKNLRFKRFFKANKEEFIKGMLLGYININTGFVYLHRIKLGTSTAIDNVEGLTIAVTKNEALIDDGYVYVTDYACGKYGITCSIDNL